MFLGYFVFLYFYVFFSEHVIHLWLKKKHLYAYAKKSIFFLAVDRILLIKLQKEYLCREGNETWNYSHDLSARLNLEQQKSSQEKEITWSVEEETFVRVRERGVKETVFISLQQILIYHLLCSKHWAHSKKENKNVKGTNSPPGEREMGTYDVDVLRKKSDLQGWALASIKFWRKSVEGVSEGSFSET